MHHNACISNCNITNARVDMRARAETRRQVALVARRPVAVGDVLFEIFHFQSLDILLKVCVPHVTNYIPNPTYSEHHHQ
jgi:hypothetical protein